MATTVERSAIHQTASGRLLEILPGLASWLFLLSPIILSFIQPLWVAYIIITYDLLWLVKAFGLSSRMVRGYRRMHVSDQIDWNSRLSDLSDLPRALSRIEARLDRRRLSFKQRRRLSQYRDQLHSLQSASDLLDPHEVVHVALIAAYNESADILEPTIKSLTKSDYPADKIWVVVAYEERGGRAMAKLAKSLMKKYGHEFAYATAIQHPSNIPGEARAKAGNITYAARRVTKVVAERGIDPAKVVVTTLDADNRPSRNYFSYLTFAYATAADRTHKSYQPIPMYYNNIWDVPAPMRVVASGNSFWILTEAMRSHRLRNFSAHAQSLQSLIDTDYWNVQSIVEDGHQFWRTYFTYDGNHEVVPLYTSIYQDAVLAKTYLKTFKVQFYQLRRWAWGVSDIPYVIVNSLHNKKIAWSNKILQLMRLAEGHFSWATAPLVLAFAAWLPLLINADVSDQILVHQLPIVASRIQLLATIGIIVTVLISMVSLPKRPAHRRRHRYVTMVIQWVLLPVTTIIFGAFAALNAQTRLMFGRYLEDFEVTEKATKQ